MTDHVLQHFEWSRYGATGRCFFEHPFALLRPSTEKHVSLIPELKHCQVRDHGDPWIVSFSFLNHDFFVDCHSHSGVTSFISVKPDCPDEVLLQVIDLFSIPMNIAAGHEPRGCDLLKSPAPQNRRNACIRWALRIASVVSACIAIAGFFNGDYQSTAGFAAGTIFLGVVSFCSNFASRDTY